MTDMELENKNEVAEDQETSPTKSQTAEEDYGDVESSVKTPTSLGADLDKEEAETPMEPSGHLDSAEDQTVEEGENLEKEGTDELQIGKEKNEDTENAVETPSKADTSSGTAPKRLRGKPKVVKKSLAGSSVKTRKGLPTTKVPVKPSTELPSADDQMTDVGKSLKEEAITPPIDEEKNEEADNPVEPSPTVDTAKTTPKMLRARPKLVKKALAGSSLNSAIGAAATGTKQMKKKIIKKKIVKVVKNGSGGNENGVASTSEDVQKDIGVEKPTEKVVNTSDDVPKDSGDEKPTEKDKVTPKNEQVIGESSKTQENQMGNGKQTVGRRRIRKRKQKTEGGGGRQIVQKKIRPNSDVTANQGEKRKGTMDSKDENHQSEKKKKKKEIEMVDDRGKSAGDMKGERHGGLIFMCSSKTKPDCLNYHVMGVPNGKKDLVLNIKPGLKLFLYDFDLRLMYGIFEASSSGGMKLEPKAFGGAFPYQVRFKVYKDCAPLPEAVFKKAMKENYNAKNKFDFKLTSLQVRKLTALFRPADSAPSQSIPSVPCRAAATTKGSGGRREARNADVGRREVQSSRRPDRDPKAKGGRRPRPVNRRERGDRVSSQVRPRELLLPRGEPRRERDLYMSEREYREYGLQADRRNLTPPLPRRSLEAYRERQRVEPVYRDHRPLPVGRDVDPLYYPPREVDPYAGRGEFHYGGPSSTTSARSPPTASVVDRYYPSYNYGGPSPSSYLSDLRREVSSGSYPLYSRRDTTYLTETESLRPRERERERETERADPLYASDRLPRYDDARYYPSEGNADALVSSRYSFGGPSSYTYR